jgi:hypothetical protein
MPVLDRVLAGHHSATPLVTVLEDLEQIALLFFGQGGEAEVLEDDHLEAGELSKVHATDIS